MVRMLLELTGSMQVLTGGGPTVRATLTYDPDSGEHVMGVRLDPRWDATLNAPRASTVADVASSVWHEAEHALRLEQEPPDPLAGVDALRVQDLEVAAHEAERLFLGWLRRRVGKAVLSADLEAAAAWNAELTEAVVRLQTHPNGSRYLESAGRPDLDGRLHLHSSAGRDDDQPYRTVPAIRGSSLMPAKQLVMPTTEEPGQVLRHLATMTGSPVGILGPIDAIETEQDGAPAVLWEVEMPGLNLVTLAVRVGDPRVLLAIRDTRDDPAPAVAISREVGGMLEVVLAPWLGIPEAMEVLARQLGEAAAPVLTTTIGLRADDRFVGEVFQLAAFLELHGLVRDGQARVTDIEPGLAGDLEARLYGFKLRGPGSIERWELARSILPEEFGDVLAELAATGEEHYRLPGLTTKVERELRGLEAEVRKEILDAIRKLQYEPRPNGAIKLTGLDLWRIKVQRDYRVVYGIDDQSRMVSVEAVRHRSTGYGHL
jgi:mRNA interferase RelE/StbE